MQETTIQEKFEKLPPVIREAITSVDFAEKLQHIGKNNNLHLDELDALFEEVGFVMLGETRTQDFASKIAERLSLRTEQVAPLVKSVDEEIFRPIRTALISLHDNEPRRITDIPLPQASSSSYIPPVPTAQVINPIYHDQLLETTIPSSPQTLGDGVVVTPITNALTEEIPSREHLLNSIEQETTPNPNLLTPHRQLESSDPKVYLLSKEELLKKVSLSDNTGGGEQLSTPPLKKRSLAEEAVIVAKRKADPKNLSMENIIKTAPTPSLPPKSIETSIPTISINNSTPEVKPLVTPPKIPPAPTITTPLKPADKLASTVQIPRVVSTVTAPLTSSSSGSAVGESRVDPYREPI